MLTFVFTLADDRIARLEIAHERFPYLTGKRALVGRAHGAPARRPSSFFASSARRS